MVASFSTTRRTVLVWLAAWLACTCLTLLGLARTTTASVDPDEIYWIGSAYYFDLAFNRRDWDHPEWSSLSARENPPVSKYAIGAALALSGQRIVDKQMIVCFRLIFRDRPRSQAESADFELLRAEIGDATLATCGGPLGGPGVTRKRELAALARRATLACGVLASLVMLVLGARVANRPTGLVASQLLLLHPIVAYSYNHAMADAVALFFSLAAALAAWTFVQQLLADAAISRRTAVGLAVLNGVAMALACAAKMNALVMVMFFGGCVAAMALVAWRRGDAARARIALVVGAASVAIGLLVFTVVNPALLATFPQAYVDLVGLPKRGLEFLMTAMPHIRLAGPLARFEAVSHVTTGPGTFVLGALVATLSIVRWPRPGMWFVLGWWMLAVLIVGLWIPVAWPRYVMPVIAPSALLAAYAIVSAARLVRFGRAS